MKNFLKKIITILFLLNTNLFATDWGTQEGESISGYFKSNKKILSK